MKRKRGRKPKLLMSIDPNRPPHKDNWASEKQEVGDERSDSESSEHGELRGFGDVLLGAVVSQGWSAVTEDPVSDDLAESESAFKAPSMQRI